MVHDRQGGLGEHRTRTRRNAAQAAQAGDTVFITAGTYTTTAPRTACASGARWAVALNPANSGTNGLAITFLGVGTVNIYLASGIRRADHWRRQQGLHRLGQRQDRRAGRARCLLSRHRPGGAACDDRVQDLNSTIRGTHKAPWGDNYNGIRTEAVNGATIAGNVIYDVTCDWGSNCAGVMMYDTANSVFEHNRIYNTATAVFIKGDHAADGWPQIDNVFRFNWIENTSGSGFRGIAAEGSKLYQNILKDNPYNFRFAGNANGTDNVFVVNNTVISTNVHAADAGYSASADIADMDNVRVRNNIFAGSLSEAINLGDAPSLGTHSFEHNVYFGFDVFGSLNGAQISYNTWKGTLNQDNASPAGINSDPLFVDATLYKLQAGSPARTVGVDSARLERERQHHGRHSGRRLHQRPRDDGPWQQRHAAAGCRGSRD